MSWIKVLKRYNISKDNNLFLYDLISNKLENTIYKFKFEKVFTCMCSGREKFMLLDLNQQCYIINEILKILHCNVVTGDLKLIGGSGQSGTVSANSALSNIKNVKSVKLINQSVTGLFESETELLNL